MLIVEMPLNFTKMLFRPIRITKIMKSMITVKINFKGAAVTPNNARMFPQNIE